MLYTAVALAIRPGCMQSYHVYGSPCIVLYVGACGQQYLYVKWPNTDRIPDAIIVRKKTRKIHGREIISESSVQTGFPPMF